ncbi:MAG: hypothetical protein AAGC47_03520, partial [Bacteroidota bacterium]
MVSTLSEAFDDYSQYVVSQYGITGDYSSDFALKLGNDPSNFNEEFIASFFESEFLQTKVLGNTNWMIGRDWESYEDFAKNFDDKVHYINQSVIAEFGISDTTYLLPQVMQAGAPDWLKTGFVALMIFGFAVLGG